ncbi:hypothetical protein P691DRAFT_812828 [Macrolepiota fuliginosa MF-IS2]|uniref:Uncharacterized protein n=1 Tax=Macrolepiota fuliginosa MF-IS2 TaxID=1400762 RepID=A0A9P5XHA8_9AGAR|nr:hypothetical protein P691DRAFT_812828 [Macrolepiota fuliginosa MF-IS2]
MAKGPSSWIADFQNLVLRPPNNRPLLLRYDPVLTPVLRELKHLQHRISSVTSNIVTITTVTALTMAMTTLATAEIMPIIPLPIAENIAPIVIQCQGF